MNTADIEKLITAWDELEQDVIAHKIRLELIQGASIWSVLYPEVVE